MKAEELLERIDKEFNGGRPDIPQLITSNKRYTDWTGDRMVRIDQILINAFVGDSYYDVEGIMNNEKARLVNSLQHRGEVRVSLPFPYTDVQEMKDVISHVLDHFGSAISLDQIIDESSKGRRISDPYGYLLITIYSFYVIV